MPVNYGGLSKRRNDALKSHIDDHRFCFNGWRYWMIWSGGVTEPTTYKVGHWISDSGFSGPPCQDAPINPGLLIEISLEEEDQSYQFSGSGRTRKDYPAGHPRESESQIPLRVGYMHRNQPPKKITHSVSHDHYFLRIFQNKHNLIETTKISANFID